MFEGLKDFSQKRKLKAAILAEIKKLPQGAYLSLPRTGQKGADEAFERAVIEVVKESGGRLMAQSFGDRITVGRTQNFKAAMSADALLHLEEKGLAISSAAAAELESIPTGPDTRVKDVVDEPPAGGE